MKRRAADDRAEILDFKSAVWLVCVSFAALVVICGFFLLIVVRNTWGGIVLFIKYLTTVARFVAWSSWKRLIDFYDGINRWIDHKFDELFGVGK